MRLAIPVRIAAAAAACLAAAVAAQTPAPHYIAVVSDADTHPFNAEGTEPWQSPPPGTDRLTLLPLPLDARRTSFSGIGVGNSWWGPSMAITASPDGRTIFAIESQYSRGERPNAKNTLDLQGGHLLRAVDVSRIDAPRVIATADIFPGPRSISSSPDGKTFVMAAYNYPGGDLGFVTWNGKGFGAPRYFKLPGLDDIRPVTGKAPLAYQSVWHPQRDVIAVTLSNSSAILFYKVDRDASGEVSKLTPLGMPVRVNRATFGGVWSPDGRYYFASETLWGGLNPHNTNGPPTLVEVIRFNEKAQSDAKAQHVITNGTFVPRNAEGLTISHDGRWAATVSFGQTWLKPGDPYRTRSTVTLLRFDADAGVLTSVASTQFDGIIPEDIKFSPDDRQLFAVSFNYEDDRSHGGLEVFDIAGRARKPTLRHARTIKLTHGAHTLLVH